MHYGERYIHALASLVLPLDKLLSTALVRIGLHAVSSHVAWCHVATFGHGQAELAAVLGGMIQLGLSFVSGGEASAQALEIGRGFCCRGFCCCWASRSQRTFLFR